MGKADAIAYPPRGLSREESARYIGVGTTKFDEMVDDGRMPKPRKIDGRTVWDRVELDISFSDLPHQNGGNVPKWQWQCIRLWSNGHGGENRMAKHPDYPRASSFQDRHDKTRWRFLGRKGQKNVTLPGEPGSPEFVTAYRLAELGRPKQAAIVNLPTAAHPRSLRAAYRLLKETDEWKKLDEKKTRDNYIDMIEEILDMPAGDSGMTLGDGPMGDLKRSHIKKILAKYSDRPFMERRALTCLRKMIVVAIEEEWINGDPAYGIVRNPKAAGFKAWSAEAMSKYEAYWKVGTPPRTAYALGLWLGNRVSDVARLKWTDLVTKQVMMGKQLRTVEGFEFVQFKGRRYKAGTTIFVPMTPMLARELAPLTRDDGTVLKSDRGRPYDSHSISTMMIGWREEAGIVNESYSMHGLGKSLGVKLALADATTRQLMEALGHISIAYAELYSSEASKIRLAVQAFDNPDGNGGSRA